MSTMNQFSLACYDSVAVVFVLLHSSLVSGLQFSNLKTRVDCRISFADPVAVRHALEIVSEIATRDPYAVAMALGNSVHLNKFFIKMVFQCFIAYSFLIQCWKQISPKFPKSNASWTFLCRKACAAWRYAYWTFTVFASFVSLCFMFFFFFFLQRKIQGSCMSEHNMRTMKI